MKAGLEDQPKDAVTTSDRGDAILVGTGTRGIQRRDFVRLFVAATLAPAGLMGQSAQHSRPAELPAAAPVPWMRGINPSTPIPSASAAETVAEGDLKFFTITQMATLSHLCDVLLPRIGSTPGAVEAGTPAFLDFLIGESPKERKSMYQGGLDWLDTESNKQFAKPFAALQMDEADRLLKPWLRTWMTDHLPTEPHADFVNTAHSDIRAATVNSRAWGKAPKTGNQESTAKGLYWSPVDPDMCWNHSEVKSTAVSR